jgi:hypothetical protein
MVMLLGALSIVDRPARSKSDGSIHSVTGNRVTQTVK